MIQSRADRICQRMAELDVDVLLLATGAELPWLTNIDIDTRERLTMFVLHADGRNALVAPLLESRRIGDRDGLNQIIPCPDGHDPVEKVSMLCQGAKRIAIGDQTWTKFMLELQKFLPDVTWISATAVVSPVREVKDQAEIDLLTAASDAVDRVANQLLAGNVPLVGRTEVQINADISQRLLDEGFDYVDFCTIGSGPNGASPHHDVGERVVQANDVVVCDFGGPRNKYNADITRTVFTGKPTDEMRRVYELVQQSQQAGFQAAKVGTPANEVDAAARRVIDDAGYGDFFIHRLGHGIGLEVHENPYMAWNNAEPVLAGNAFSIEPGIYLPNKFGVRIEDIVVATTDGPRRLNNASRELTVVG